MIKELQDYLARELNIHFGSPVLLAEAFTQASCVNEHPNQGLKYYEQTKFLGDVVLELIVSGYIYKRFPELPQGKLARLRAAMVRENSFSKFVKECHFDQYIRLGHGEEMAGAGKRPGLLCDIFESFIGALYLDQGRSAVEKFVQRAIFPRLDMDWFNHAVDAKTSLQEFLQRDGDITIEYHLVEESETENDPEFKVNVIVNGDVIDKGKGSSEKYAEIRATQQALDSMRNKNK